jgi:Nucleotide-diphospho-sugar transferase
MLSSLHDASGIALTPVFVKQSFFTKVEGESDHAFNGISIKFRVCLNALKKNKGKFVVLSDADLVIQQKDSLSAYFEKYKVNDITCMRDSFKNNDYNIGLMLVKSTDDTIALFQKVHDRIINEKGWDQLLFNEEIQHFSGTHALFSVPEMCQSNMFEHVDSPETLVIQALVSMEDSELAFIEKLLTICRYYDITHLKYLLSDTIIAGLIELSYKYDPISYVCSWGPTHTDGECSRQGPPSSSGTEQCAPSSPQTEAGTGECGKGDPSC